MDSIEEAIHILKNGKIFKRDCIIRLNYRCFCFKFFGNWVLSDADGMNRTEIDLNMNHPRIGELILYIRTKLPHAFREWKEWESIK